MLNAFSRTELLLGKDIELLKDCTVAVFGIGGVGSFSAEALARSGIGKLCLYDDDVVSLTNINRQLIALHSTVGKAKVDVMKARILDINPDAEVEANRCFFSAETLSDINFDRFDYIVDAIDTVSSKLLLIETAYHKGIPIISAMGAGNKLDPTRFEVTDIYKTEVCPLARVMRRELKARNISSLKVVYSKEPPIKPLESEENEPHLQTPRTKRQVPGSIAFVPSVAGLILAGEVIKSLIAASK
ncbi:MAG: tRNA threonylcarbamoyladenosine dehydratase [Clostridiales bacterium]|jgi:tRNA A37 threonylcarbamoyladenosine dehydratase|nr:tRNA threonylcarbamoyladenosine dehydratase [Clostridiales bacterium]